MKLLTLNTHSLADGDGQKEIKLLCDFIAKELPDVIALQEVNQSTLQKDADIDHISKLYRAAATARPVRLKKDNFVLRLVWELALIGEKYYFSWLPIKVGYGRFDEGLAILAREPIYTALGFYISKITDYENHKTRMALLVTFENSNVSICNIHASRSDDPDEPFYDQWKRLIPQISAEKRVILMGDFNNPADERGGGYDRIIESGFYDMYELAISRRGKDTVCGAIDGWRDVGELGEGQRIDFILADFVPDGRIFYRTVLDGKDGEVISDHFGVLVEIDERFNG